MYTALVIIEIVLSLALIGLILIQHGKGADAGAAFGSGSAGTVFGAGGSASVLSKITTWIAVAFFVVTLALSYMAKERVSEAVQISKKPTSIVQDIVPDAEQGQADAGNTSPMMPMETSNQGIQSIPQEASMPSSNAQSEASEGVPAVNDIPVQQ